MKETTQESELNRIKLHYKETQPGGKRCNATPRARRPDEAVTRWPGDLCLNVHHDGHILKSPAWQHISDTAEGSSVWLNLHVFGSWVEASARPHRSLLLVRPLLRWESGGGTRHEAAELWAPSAEEVETPEWTERRLTEISDELQAGEQSRYNPESHKNYTYWTNLLTVSLRFASKYLVLVEKKPWSLTESIFFSQKGGWKCGDN